MAFADLYPRVRQWWPLFVESGQRHGVDPYLGAGICDVETLCGATPQLDRPGPSGTGDYGPRRWSRYEGRPNAKDILKVWQPDLAEFTQHFPRFKLKPGDPIPFLCRPADERGWGRGLFQHDLMGDGQEYGGETQTAFCLRQLPDGRLAWEDPATNIDRGFLLLRACLDAFGADEELAACAYNAGTANVHNALLAISGPASDDKRHEAANSVTTGKNYGQNVCDRRDRFRRLMEIPDTDDEPTNA